MLVKRHSLNSCRRTLAYTEKSHNISVVVEKTPYSSFAVEQILQVKEAFQRFSWRPGRPPVLILARPHHDEALKGPA